MKFPRPSIGMNDGYDIDVGIFPTDYGGYYAALLGDPSALLPAIDSDLLGELPVLSHTGDAEASTISNQNPASSEPSTDRHMFEASEGLNRGPSESAEQSYVSPRANANAEKQLNKHTPAEWEAIRRTFKTLYIDQQKPLPEVKKFFDEHGFVATERMYKSRIKLWDLPKRTPKTQESENRTLRNSES